MFTIYKITNTFNLKLYVGQTTKPIEKRFLQHAKANLPLGEAMRQCGLDNFTIEVIEECETQEQVNHQERFWIKVLKRKIPNGYNCSNGGESGVRRKPNIFQTSFSPMKLGEWMKMYREKHNMKMQDLAKVPSKALSNEQENILKAYDELNSEGRRDFWGYLEFLKYKYTPTIVLGANFNTNITVK